MDKVHTPWLFFLGEDYLDYRRRNAAVGDAKEIMNGVTQAVVREISAQTKNLLIGHENIREESIRAIQALAAWQPRVIHQEWNSDFDKLFRAFGLSISGDLNKISDQISGLNSTFEWCCSEVLGSLGGIQDTLSQILDAVQNPAKTAAFEKFEDARDAFRRQLYPECLKYLDQAIDLYEMEWRFYFLRGVVRLGSATIPLSLIHLGEAEVSFLAASRFARHDEPKDAAKAFMQASWAAFGQHKLKDAINYANEALALDPDLAEVWYQAAKFVLINGDLQRGLDYLGRAVDMDAGYILKLDTDPNFSPYRNHIYAMLETKRQEKVKAIWMNPNTNPISHGLPGAPWERLWWYGLLDLIAYENASTRAIQNHLRSQVEKKERAEKEREEREEHEKWHRVEQERIEESQKRKAEYFARLRRACEDLQNNEIHHVMHCKGSPLFFLDYIFPCKHETLCVELGVLERVLAEGRDLYSSDPEYVKIAIYCHEYRQRALSWID